MWMLRRAAARRVWKAMRARLAQFLEVTVPRSEAADGVDHQIDLHSRAGAFGQGFNEAACHFALLENVGFEVDAVRGPANGGQLRLVKGLAVRQHVDAAV